MKPRLVIVFLLLVIAPLAALAWLGLKVIRDESEMVQHRFDEFAMQELAGLDNTIVKVVDRWKRELDRVTGLDGLEIDALRERARKERSVRQMFVLDAEGKRYHPPPDGPRNQSEDLFLARTRSIWESSEAFFRPDDSGAGVADPSEPQGGQGQQLRPQASASASRQVASRNLAYNNPPQAESPGHGLSTGPDSGWYTWYWGRGVNLIYWHRKPDGQVVGAEVDRMALIADILGELPDTNPGDPDGQPGRIRLVDSNGNTVYEWGLRNPGTEERPRVSRAVSPPLGSWKLEYFPAEETMEAAFGGGILFGMTTGFVALLLVVMGLAAYFLREGGREIREAEERVTFVNQVSHELKTPLTNIRMYADLLEDELEDDDDKMAASHVKVITSESRRLSRLIGNVLTFARKGRGKLTVRPVAGCVDDAVREVLDQFRPSLHSKGVAVKWDPGAGDMVRVDADALGQILANLLSNVEKYAASGGLVEISTRFRSDRTVVDVADRGPGVPAGIRDKVFQPFYRISGKVEDGVTGTGIGLSISRDLARLHGGDLTLEPASRGACFRVTLDTPAG